MRTRGNSNISVEGIFANMTDFYLELMVAAVVCLGIKTT